MTQQPRHVTCRSAALRCVQPFALRQGDLRWRRVVPADASAGDPDVFRLGSLLALGDVELDLLPFLQAAVAATGDRAEVHEHVRAALDRDEAVAFVAVEPLHSALRHLDLLVVHAAPRHGRGRARHLLWPACHGTRGEWKACGWLTARQLELSPLGQRVRLERTPGPGAHAPRTRSRMLTGPSRVLTVPEGDHRRSAIVVVTLRGSQR